MTTPGFVRTITENNGLSIQGKIASWARNHNLGFSVDFAEWLVYRNPPNDKSPDQLPSLLPNNDSLSATTQEPPSDLHLVHNPPLPSEGKWTSVRNVDAMSAIWTTSIRPNSKHKAITATHTLIDQTNLFAVLHNGTEVPGGTNWVHSNKLSSTEVRQAVFAFNGAFRREHSGGGYFTEGREIWPLKNGVASLAIDSAGKLHVGRWNIDMNREGEGGKEWVSVRQNLELLVINGELSSRLDTGYWGGGAKGEIFILRSAVCVRFDGKIVFTISGPSDATSLAQTMKSVGCKNAMQLDQNESYPRGYVFINRKPFKIDARMRGHDDDFVRGYDRDFFVLLAK